MDREVTEFDSQHKFLFMGTSSNIFLGSLCCMIMMFICCMEINFKSIWKIFIEMVEYKKAVIQCHQIFEFHYINCRNCSSLGNFFQIQ